MLQFEVYLVGQILGYGLLWTCIIAIRSTGFGRGVMLWGPGPWPWQAQGLVLGKRVGPVGRNVKLEFKAQGLNGFGGLVPYISPPLIRARSSRTNQEIQEAITIWEAQQADIGWLRNPLMCPQKACCVWLLVQPSSLSDGSWTEAARVWQLRWGFVGSPASQLLNVIYSPFGPYK